MRGLATVLLLSCLAAGCGDESESAPPPPATPPPAPVAPVVNAPTEPEVQPDPYRVRAIRTANELLVFAVRSGRAAPASRVPVRVLPTDGDDPIEAVTLSRGVAILRVSAEVEGAITIGPEGRVTTIELPPPPVSTETEPTEDGLLLTDRTEARPGDTVRVALWLSRFSDRDEAGELLLPGPGKRTERFLPGGGRAPGWTVASIPIPFDARPGVARVKWKNATTLLPLRGRLSDSPAFDVPDDAPADPADTPVEGELQIAPEDGQWRVTAPGPLDGRPLLLVAHDDREIITHETATVEGDSALLRLALGERSPEGITLLAVTADRDDFPEGRVALESLWAGADLVLTATPLEGGTQLQLEASVSGDAELERLVVALDDPDRPHVRPRLHRLDGATPRQVLGNLDPGACYRIRGIGQLQGGGRVVRAELPPLDPVPGEPAAPLPPFQRPADLLEAAGRVRPVPLTRWSVRVDLAPGSAMAESHRRALLAARRQALTWALLAPEDAEGPVRLTSDGVIVLETRLEAGSDAGRRGVLDRIVLEDDPLELMAAVPGLEALRLEALVLESGLDDPAANEGYAVTRTVRRDGDRTEQMVAVVTIRGKDAMGRTFVELPLPGGVVLDVEGWELREATCSALPEGSHDVVRLLRSTTALHWDLPVIPAAGLT
ncbi:MAG: hypothetical protein ACYTDX_08005, partial [Planctomycetota bacterium]